MDPVLIAASFSLAKDRKVHDSSPLDGRMNHYATESGPYAGFRSTNLRRSSKSTPKNKPH